jgi:hypothetical protein
MGVFMIYHNDLKALDMIASGNSCPAVILLESNVSWVCVRFGVVRLTEMMA